MPRGIYKGNHHGNKPVLCPHGILGLSKCIICVRLSAKLRQRIVRKTPEGKAYMKAYYSRPEVKLRFKAYEAKPEMVEYRRAYRNKPENKQHQKEYNKNLRETTKLAVFLHYGGGKVQCVNCGYSDIRALSIDHVNNNGAEHRKEMLGENYGKKYRCAGFHTWQWLQKNGYPRGFQLLCMNCQWLKRNGVAINKEPITISNL